MVRKYRISFSSTTKFRLKLMFCVIFVNVLVWQRFGVPLFPICAPLFPVHVPLISICVTLSTYTISRYFCKDSLMTPPTHHPTSSLFTVTVTPPKIFIVPFPSFSIRVHSSSIRVHSCSLVFIRVPFMFTHVHSCSIHDPFVFHSCSLVFTRVHSCSFVFIRVQSFVFQSVWCFRYDREKVVIAEALSKSQNRVCLSIRKSFDSFKSTKYWHCFTNSSISWRSRSFCETTPVPFVFNKAQADKI